MTGRAETIVHLAGSRWDNVHGTDHRLAAALGVKVPVLWVDPPLPLTHAMSGRWRKDPGAPPRDLDLARVAPGVTRLRSLSLPAFTRPGFRTAAAAILERAVARTLERLRCRSAAVVVSSPSMVFPKGIEGVRVLYVTDDWIAGAPMMGLSPRSVEKTLIRNLGYADVAAAVSPFLAERLSAVSGRRNGIVVLPNGCGQSIAVQVARQHIAGLVGQLNERLDLDLLESVQAAGTRILVIGPRTDRDPATGRRLDRFLSAGNVEWIGEVPPHEVPGHLATIGVGMTPYADNEFNRSSFPLKTLDYLAAGVPVVATDLPAVRWLDTPCIEISDGPVDFARRVNRILSQPADPAADETRRLVSHAHSWEKRADQLLALIREGTR